MTPRQTAGDASVRNILDGPFRLLMLLSVALIVLAVVRLVAGAVPTGARPTLDGHLLADARPAPALNLTGGDAQPVSLAAMRGTPVLVFFGYTHCPDVCPATIGRVGLAIEGYGRPARAIFVTVDPERDTVAWLSEFMRFTPAGLSTVTGTAQAVRGTADAWGVRYARVETADPGAYSMAHTADVFLVDADGWLRATFPFGTEATAMTATMLHVAASPLGSVPIPPPSPTSPIVATPAPVQTTAAPGEASPGEASPGSSPIAPTPSIVPTTSTELWPRIISSTVWAGGASPVILALYDVSGPRINDPGLRVPAQVLDAHGEQIGRRVLAPAVQPHGLAEVSFVPTLDFPSAGGWRLRIEATTASGAIRHGIVDVVALEQGGSAALGAPAPRVRTPTADDVGGDLRRLTTDPSPDPRLLATSTADTLAAGTPFVLVVDSIKFKVTRSCGQAEYLARQLVNRWDPVPFIHLEPYHYSIVDGEAVLEGSLAAPRLTDAAEAWGTGSEPWGVRAMPWVFIVDGHGVVRAKSQGVIGTADVDVLLTLLTGGG